MSSLEVVKGVNDWLKDYRGKTFSEKLQASLVRGLFQEHSKKASGIRTKSNYISERMGKKCVVYCMEPETKEILDIGGSSLLRDPKTGKYEDNLILDNFGLFLSTVFMDGTSYTPSLKDDENSSILFSTYTQLAFTTPGNSCNAVGKFGSGITGPARSDYKIETDLLAAPESGYINLSAWGYNVSNQVIYNIDASPTGGSGIVNEVGTFGNWTRQNIGVVLHKFMLTHDSVGPIVYVAGKLLRAAYAWQI